MRFLSKFGRFGVQIRPMITENYATGMSAVVQKPLYAMFREGDLRPEEREIAFARWTWNGFYQEQDEVTVVQPDYRIGVFDSLAAQTMNDWSDEERHWVETELAAMADMYGDMLPVPRTLVPAPWPNYDSFAGSPDDLIALLVDQGHDLAQTLRYEEAMQGRPEIIFALEAALAGNDGFRDFDPSEEVILG